MQEVYWFQLHRYGLSTLIFIAGLFLSFEIFYFYQENFWRHWGELIIGLLTSTLLSSYVFILVGRRIFIEKKLQDQNNKLTHINSILQQEIDDRRRIEENIIAKKEYLQKRHETLKYVTKLTTSELRNAIMIEQSVRRKIEKFLKDSEERLRFITQHSIDGIISINSSGTIVSWNYGAQQIFGYDEAEIVGKPLQQILPQNEILLQSEINTKPKELKGRHHDGFHFSVEISHTHLKNEDNFFDTMIIRDITDRKEYEKRLIKALRDANTANAAKSEFLATISHELRTPLNAIIGFNQCLLIEMDGPINSSQQESLKKIEKSSFHLLSLINDILDWSKIEAKKMEIEVFPQNIVELITSCVEDMQPLALQKNLTIELLLDSAFILVEIDRMRIQQVLLNLLSNAVKFTEIGSIKIRLFDERDRVLIQITDTGIGLSPEELEKIFHPFSQADSSITRKYGGSGLGLVISTNIINLHKGSITVESEKGCGSTFTIILPKSQ